MNSIKLFVALFLWGLPFQGEAQRGTSKPDNNASKAQQDKTNQSITQPGTTKHSIAQDTSYEETPIQLQTEKGTISGSLLTPTGFTSGPVVLVIAGSGPTDRDGNNPMMKNNSLKFLATNLGQHGIASLRYDKRGIGQSKSAGKKEEKLRFEDYANDAAGWVSLLKKDRRFTSVIIIGHSEGSLLGMLAASGADKFISLAGAGQSAEKILKDQLAIQPQAVKDLAFPILDSLKAGHTVENVDPMLFALFRPGVQPYMISWFKYDPQVEIAKLKIPVLIVHGTTDIQVSTEEAQRLSRANPQAKLVLVENMNHILKTVAADRNANLATYIDPELPVSTQLVEVIREFVHGGTQKSSNK